MTNWSPEGSHALADFARQRGLYYQAQPAEGYFRSFEPHDTLVAPQHFYNAITFPGPFGSNIVVEPWTTVEGADPIERGLLGFAQHNKLRRRAAIRVGESFMTRVAFLESAPPPQVTLGDPVWDAHVKTFAASASEAVSALPERLRDLLKRRGFRGQLEIRPGGFIVYCEGLQPIPANIDTMMRVMSDIAHAI